MTCLSCLSLFLLVVRCQSCPPSETDREELLVKKAKEFYYRHRGSFSGAVSMAKDRNTSLLLDSHKRSVRFKWLVSQQWILKCMMIVIVLRKEKRNRISWFIAVIIASLRCFEKQDRFIAMNIKYSLMIMMIIVNGKKEQQYEIKQLTGVL